MLNHIPNTIRTMAISTKIAIKNSFDNFCAKEILVKSFLFSMCSVAKSHFEQINEDGFPAMYMIPGGNDMPMQYCHHLKRGSNVPFEQLGQMPYLRPSIFCLLKSSPKPIHSGLCFLI